MNSVVVLYFIGASGLDFHRFLPQEHTIALKVRNRRKFLRIIHQSRKALSPILVCQEKSCLYRVNDRNNKLVY